MHQIEIVVHLILGEALGIVDPMTKTTHDSKPQMPAPRAGMIIEPVTTYEEVPIVTEGARAELLASLERGEEDRAAGRVKRMSVEELKADMRAEFERITGHNIP
jgi:hypothetical protein